MNRKRCPTTGKVELSLTGAEMVVARVPEFTKYPCGEHWHVGHPPGKSRRARKERATRR